MSTPQGFPTVRLPGTFAIPSIAPVYADGIPLAQVQIPSGETSSTQDFWSSQPRPAGDPHAEELIVSLGQPRLINYISFDLPHFPHTLTIWWWDGSQWQPAIGTGSIQLQFVTTGSVPSVVDNPAALNLGQNPYHYGAGHWVHHDEQITPVTTTKLLLRGIRLARTSSAQKFPVSPQGRHVAYPLGVRNLDFGSRLLSSADVPPAPRDPEVLTQRQVFTTTADINGSPVQVAIRENRASDLLRGATWRSGPQPSHSAVTSLYLDARDAAGEPQLIDRFYLEPVTSGVRFNLYYSPVPPPSGTTFAAVDDPLLPELIAAAGTALPAVGHGGIAFPNSPGWLTLSNQAAGTVADAPWWAGIEIMPGFGSADPGTYVIVDAGLLQLSFSGGQWTATMPTPNAPGAPNQPSGGVLGQWAFPFSPGDRLQFVAGYDGQSFFVWCSPGPLFQTPVTGPVPPAPAFRFGGLQGIDPTQQVLTGNYILAAYILKQEQVDLTVGGQGGIPPDFLAFAADAAAYVAPAPSGYQPTTQNAVARFAPVFILGSVCPWGFVGGIGQAYEACPWVPVQRDYKLARGYVEFNPVMAAAWKFEFTNLQPEPFEYLKPVVHKARYFPSSLVPGASAKHPSTPAVLDPGLAVNQAVAPTISFADTAIQPPDATPGVPLPTEALYATDPAGAANMAAQGGSLYNFQQWQPDYLIAKNPYLGPVPYQEQEITVASRVAYFVALSSIAMFRLDYTAADDTDQYLDTFADIHNISPASLAPGGWSWQAAGGLVAPSNLTGPAQAQSVVFNSLHAVTGVQFATVQSDPIQLLDNPDFSEPGFDSWGPVGDALPLAPAPVNAQLGNMAQVSRGQGSPELNVPVQPKSWAYLQSTYATWIALETAIPSWYDFGLPPVSTAMGGIGYKGAPVKTTTAGRLYAAARVLSPVALSAPLYLQLLDGVSGAVIAEAEQVVAGGSVTEWFVGYTLGQAQISANTWQQVATAYPTWSATAGLTWTQVDTSVAPLGATVGARLIQKESTDDTWATDNISVFEDALVWSFSNDGGNTWYPAYDIRNNPRGALTFPAAAPGQGTQLMWQVSAYRAGVNVSSLAIRPWYTTWPRGVMPRPAGIGHGPNMVPQDHYPPVEKDPRWQVSSSPIPDSWYFRVRQALALTLPGNDFPGPAAPPPDAGLGDALVYEPPSVAAQEPETYIDVYTDVYTDQYAPADSGDIYTDTYSDVYGQDYPVITGTQRLAVVSFAGTGILSATALGIPLPASGLGADFGPVAASSTSISAWTSAFGLPVPARRIALGNQIPATLAASPAAGDAGVRRVLFDVRPDATTTAAQLDAFLASCQAGGLQASVSIWAEADRSFINSQDYLNLLPDYVSAIRRNGYQHVFTITNVSITHNGLAVWYPGDDLVDVIAPTFWCTGPAPGSGGDTLAVAQAFADAHAKPFGLAGFGADRTKYTAAQADAFLRYVLSVFTVRKAVRGKAYSPTPPLQTPDWVAPARPSYDLIYLATGGYSLVGAPAQLVTDYKAIAAAL